jgi:spermidine synthase
MVLELVAGRILAPYIGVSIFSWTSVIGVVLGGISLGNALGGRLADRRSSIRLLGTLFVFGGLASLAILAVDILEAFTDLEGLTLGNAPLIAGLGILVITLFFVPCTILGAISPVVVKLSMHDLSHSGRTIGHIYAAGTLGSIVGTFASGFYLISRFGTHRVVWGVGVLLIGLGLVHLLLGWRMAKLQQQSQPHLNRVSALVTALLLLGALSLPLLRPAWVDGPCTRETDYFCIQVREEEYAGDSLRVLYLDRLLHSLSSLSDPTRLAYEYEQMYAEATAYQAARNPGAPLRALFIGGGGYTFPRYMEALYPDSILHVIEIDPGVTQIAHEMLGLALDTQVVTFNEDARMFLAREPSALASSLPTDRTQSAEDRGDDAGYDLIFGDAFNDFGVPYHLTTREFNNRVHAWLAEDGIYAVNLIDGPWGVLLRSYTHTLRQTFDHVYLAIKVNAWRRSPRSTLVLLATDHPIDLDTLAEMDGGDRDPQLARTLITGEELDAFLAVGRTVTLTDRYAPVDQMLIPVFLDLVPR